MLSAIVSILVFVVMVGGFLWVQFMAQANRRRGHWPQPKEQPATEGTPRKRTRARVRALRREPSCGRHLTHLLLSAAGARDSCKSCLALRETTPGEPVDLLAEAERIVKEAQD